MRGAQSLRYRLSLRPVLPALILGIALGGRHVDYGVDWQDLAPVWQVTRGWTGKGDGW